MKFKQEDIVHVIKELRAVRDRFHYILTADEASAIDSATLQLVDYVDSVSAQPLRELLNRSAMTQEENGEEALARFMGELALLLPENVK